ncbi:hypothetical protein dsx2_2621 [Desulfovibrio sp. X2]|uniref:hypothetical protein n=1 Tax=Desulfovibrio sp. X2 TaxID=941449 RepID=UPI00035873C2|nr:hypothetical protein [Desulfovibrio sp. X2]EPR42704.1 hypothetical protein dsx2_2621 [Desulfovibrio sp. X2]
MLNQITVTAEVVRLNTVYLARLPQEQIEIIAETWWRDLRLHITDDNVLRECICLARQACRTFPKSADVLRAYRESYRPPERKAVDQHAGRFCGPERSRKHAANVMAIIGGRPLPYPEVAPEKWRGWQPSGAPAHPDDGGHAVHLGKIAPETPGQGAEDADATDWGQRTRGTRHDPKCHRQGEYRGPGSEMPEGGSADNDYDAYAQAMAAEG